MKEINENPFRIIGVLANVSERELLNRSRNSQKMAKIGKELKSEFDFVILSSVSRSPEKLAKALTKIEQVPDKVLHSLFWFLNANAFDQTALGYLSNGDKVKAIEIWNKVTYGKDINSKNYSCFNNLGTFKLLMNTESSITEGIQIKLDLINSSAFKDYIKEVADETYSESKEKLQEKIADIIIGHLKGKYASRRILRLFSSVSVSLQKHISNKLTSKTISLIELEIDNVKQKREKSASSSVALGTKLYNFCKTDLSEVESILGGSNLSYKSLSDSLAKELMNCAKDYFRYWKGSKNPSKESVTLLGLAKSLAIGSQIKERIEDNINGIKDWAKTANIQDDLDFLTEKLKSFNNKRSSILTAVTLGEECKYSLMKIRKELGSGDELYMILSSAVVSRTLGMIVNVVNTAQEGLQYDRIKLMSLPGVVSKAKVGVEKVSGFDMNAETRKRYNENRRSIIKMDEDLKRIAPSSRPKPAPSGGSNGCYIATMAYGDYDHPQVMELRNFRDEVLYKSLFGRLFIKGYYMTSPHLVTVLKNKKGVNRVIRKALDKFVIFINRK